MGQKLDGGDRGVGDLKGSNPCRRALSENPEAGSGDAPDAAVGELDDGDVLSLPD